MGEYVGEQVRLTSLSHGAGCACKLPLSALDELMATLGTGPGHPGGLVPAAGDLLVGAAEGDDAAVLRLDSDRALVLTTRSSTMHVTGAGWPPPTRCPTCTRWAAGRSSRST